MGDRGAAIGDRLATEVATHKHLHSKWEEEWVKHRHHEYNLKWLKLEPDKLVFNNFKNFTVYCKLSAKLASSKTST